MIISESPWIDEVRLGYPMAGASGHLLDAQLRRAGLDRGAVVVTNVLWTKPPWLGWIDKSPDAAVALAENRHNWEELIAKMQPRAIVTLGVVAMREVLGVGGLDERQAYVHDSRYGIPVIPSYHPAFILRGNAKLTQCLYFALSRAKDVIANPSWQRTPTRYLVDPPVLEAAEYLWPWRCATLPGASDVGVYAGGKATPYPPALQQGETAAGMAAIAAPCAEVPPGQIAGLDASGRGPITQVGPLMYMESTAHGSDNFRELYRYCTRPWKAGWVPSIPLLVVDVETPNSYKLDEDELAADPSYTLLRVSLSVAPGTALTCPWNEPYIGLVRRAIASAAVLIFWNELFDVPRLVANGCVINGEVHDGMMMWHWLQSDMLKGLGFVSPFYTDLPPWKHLSEAEPAYYSACDADATMRNYLGIRSDIERQGRWPRFVRHCLRIGDLFRLPHVGRIHVSTPRQVVLRERLERERDAALERLQLEVPEAVKPVKRLKGKPRVRVESYREVHTPCACHTGEVPLSDEVVDLGGRER